MDLYALLGVPRTATAADVERAYRRMARRYHPGVNPGDQLAERMYQQVQQAYRVLGDDTNRREYDRGSVQTDDGRTVAFEGFDFSAVADGPLAATFSELFADVFQRAAREATTPTRGQDVSATLHVRFEDAVRGCQLPLSVTRHERCAGCQGRGFVMRAVVSCPACGGEGTLRWARGHMVFSRTCQVCNGDGRSIREPCAGCHGAGLVPRTDVVTIALPPGLESGSRVAVPGRGHAGALGGPNGDLYVTVAVGEHRHFTRSGADIFLTVPVAIHEAAFGTEASVPGLDGPVVVRIPPGTASGTRLILAGCGGVKPESHERGDLILTVQLVLPSTLDPRSAELLREFGRLNGDDVRRDLYDHDAR